jgi:hypothetical protein
MCYPAIAIMLTVVSAIQQQQAAKKRASEQARLREEEAKMKQRNAEIARKDAETARLQGEFEANQRRRMASIAKSKARARAVGAGVFSGSGSTLDSLEDVGNQSAMDVFNIKRNAKLQQQRFINQAEGSEASAEMSLMQARNTRNAADDAQDASFLRLGSSLNRQFEALNKP